MPQLAAGRAAAAQGGQQPGQNSRVGAQGLGITADGGAAFEHDHPGRLRDHVREIVALLADDEVYREATLEETLGQAQEGRADAAAAEAAEQQRDPA